MRSLFSTFALAVLTIGSASLAQAQEAWVEEARAVVREAVGETGPGALVAITHRGRVVFTESAGYANLDHRVPIDRNSRFYLGSLSKQFVAAAVGLLAQDGKLSLDDTVGRYVEGLGAPTAGITLRQLLHHRSGLRDYLKIRDVNGERNTPWDNSDAVEIIKRQRGLVFPPGSSYQYSNSNYILLAEVVAKVSGQDLAEFARARIFAPLALESMDFEVDRSAVLPNRVLSYSKDRRGRWHVSPKNFDAVGDGGMYACLDDLLQWGEVLRTRKELPAPVFDLLLQPPQGTMYAGGLQVRLFQGERAIDHGGFMMEFQNLFLRLLEPDIDLWILSNSGEVDVFELRERLARIAVQGLAGRALASAPATAPAPDNPPPIPFSTSTPIDPSLAGEYRNTELPLSLRLFVQDGKLFVHPSTFRPLEANRVGEREFVAMGGQLLLRASATAGRISLTLSDLGEFEFVRQSGDHAH